MKAMVYTAPSVLEMLDVPEPEAAPHEAVISVVSSGICGSELHGVQKPGFRQPPMIMGHEFAGTLADGRRVVVNPMVSCGHCDMCRRGKFYLCRTRSIVGIHRAGGFAERVNIPKANIYEIPAGMTWEQAGVVEPVANAVHAWRMAADPAPGRVAIFGGGTIGLVTLLVCLARGCTDVTVVDLSDERLDIVRRLGATSAVKSLDGEYDVIFDAVGVASTHRASVQHLRPGGTTVWIGLIGEQAEFASQDLVRMEKRVQGCFCYPDDDFRAAIRLAQSVDTSWVHCFPLDEGADIFTQLMNGRTDVIKALLVP